MSHFGFVGPPYPGHLNPMSALADELVDRGHQASFLGIADILHLVPHHPVVQVGGMRYPTGALRMLRAHMAAPRGFGLFRVIRDMSRMTDALCRELPAAIQAHGIDALVVDQLEPAGGLVAEHLGLPFVSVANALPIDREPAVPPPFTDWSYDPSPWGLRRNGGGYRVADAMMLPLGRTIGRWAAAWGLPSRTRMDECLSPRAGITQLVQGFDFPRENAPPHRHECGPLRGIEPSGDRDALPEPASSRPLAFASLGTLQGGRVGLFRAITEACRRLDLQALVAHGGALRAQDEASLPGTPIVRSFVPQRSVLARASVAITNGGLNTVLDGLAAGVPLVVVPIAFEQGAIGARLEACGAGLVVPFSRATPDRLAAAIGRVLTEPSFGTAARRLAAEIGAAGGVVRAANIVEAAVGRAAGPRLMARPA